jgi:hypothetical protein
MPVRVHCPIAEPFFSSHNVTSMASSLKIVHCAPHCQARDDRLVVYLQLSERPFDKLKRALKEVAFYRKGPEVGSGRQSGWHVPLAKVKQLAVAVKPLWHKLAVALMTARKTAKRDPENILCPGRGQTRGRLMIVKDIDAD